MHEKGVREDQRKTQKKMISSYEEYTVTLFQKRFNHQIPHNETLPKALWYNQSQSPSKKNKETGIVIVVSFEFHVTFKRFETMKIYLPNGSSHDSK